VLRRQSICADCHTACQTIRPKIEVCPFRCQANAALQTEPCVRLQNSSPPPHVPRPLGGEQPSRGLRGLSSLAFLPKRTASQCSIAMLRPPWVRFGSWHSQPPSLLRPSERTSRLDQPRAKCARTGLMHGAAAYPVSGALISEDPRLYRKPAIVFLASLRADKPHQCLFKAAFRRVGSTRVRTTG
jgi:hypothetical protein